MEDQKKPIPASQEPESGECRHKHRDAAEYDSLLRRLNRIEGQVRGVRGMVEKEAYCTDILTQVSAIQSALNAFSRSFCPTTFTPVWWRIFKTAI